MIILSTANLNQDKLAENRKGIINLDSALYRKNEDGSYNEEWPENYVRDAKIYSDAGYTVILGIFSSVAKELSENNFSWNGVHINNELITEVLQRAYDKFGEDNSDLFEYFVSNIIRQNKIALSASRVIELDLNTQDLVKYFTGKSLNTPTLTIQEVEDKINAARRDEDADVDNWG